MIHEKLFLIFGFTYCYLAIKIFISKELRFLIPLKQIDYSNFMTEFELLCRSSLVYL